MALKIKVHERLNEAFNPKTVKIGDQVWMAENLEIDDGGAGIFRQYAHLYFYNLDAADRIVKSINGWHLPDSTEIKKLLEHVKSLKDQNGFNVVPHGFASFDPHRNRVVNWEEERDVAFLRGKPIDDDYADSIVITKNSAELDIVRDFTFYNIRLIKD